MYKRKRPFDIARNNGCIFHARNHMNWEGLLGMCSPKRIWEKAFIVWNLGLFANTLSNLLRYVLLGRFSCSDEIVWTASVKACLSCNFFNALVIEQKFADMKARSCCMVLLLCMMCLTKVCLKCC